MISGTRGSAAAVGGARQHCLSVVKAPGAIKFGQHGIGQRGPRSALAPVAQPASAPSKLGSKMIVHAFLEPQWLTFFAGMGLSGAVVGWFTGAMIARNQQAVLEEVFNEQFQFLDEVSAKLRIVNTALLVGLGVSVVTLVQLLTR